MTTPPTWLGQPEGLHLEYKSGASRPRIESIAREVVAMLNADGGMVVIGVSDHGTPDGLEDAAAWTNRLRQGLMDRIEPRPLGLIVVEQRRASGRDVVEVEIQSAAPSIHAERRKGLLGFWFRVADAVIPLSLGEVRERLRESGSEVGSGAGRSRTLARELVTASADGSLALSLAFLPRFGAHFDRSTRWDILERWRALPARKSARKDGFGLDLESRYAESTNGEGKLIVDVADGYRMLQLDETGRIRVRFGESMVDRGLLLGGADGAANTWTLVEGAATACRFAALVFGNSPVRDRVDWAMALHLTPGLKVRPALPGTIAWQAGWKPEYSASGAPVACHGDSSVQDFTQNPDAVGLRVLLSLWDQLDFDAAVPLWNEDASRFEFPLR